MTSDDARTPTATLANDLCQLQDMTLHDTTSTPHNLYYFGPRVPGIPSQPVLRVKTAIEMNTRTNYETAKWRGELYKGRPSEVFLAEVARSRWGTGTKIALVCWSCKPPRLFCLKKFAENRYLRKQSQLYTASMCWADEVCPRRV